MELAQLQNAFRFKGLNVQGTMAYGEINGYPFNIMAMGKGTEINSLRASFALEKAVRNRLLKPVKTELAPIGRVSVNSSLNNLVYFTANTNMPNPVDALYGALYKMTLAFMANGLYASQICPICRQAGCDAMAQVGAGYVNTHRACIENKYVQTVQNANVNEKSGFNALALIGALLGAVIGSIPTILTILLAERIYAVLYALVPIGSFFGYKLLKGYMGKQVYPIVIICSILMLPFMELVNFIFAIHSVYNVWPTIGQTIQVYFEVMTAGDILKSFALPVIFMALGIFIACRNFVMTNADYMHDAAGVMQSMIVRGGQQPQTAQPQSVQPTYQEPAQPVYTPLENAFQQPQNTYQQPQNTNGSRDEQ